MSVVRKAMMRAALRSLAVCMGFCLTGLAIASPVAFAEGSLASGAGSVPTAVASRLAVLGHAGGSASSGRGSALKAKPLVVPGAGADRRAVLDQARPQDGCAQGAARGRADRRGRVRGGGRRAARRPASACGRERLVKKLAPKVAATASHVAFAGGSSALGGTGGSPLESPLVVPEGVSLLGGQSVHEAEEARRASPEAAVARQESQTKYEGLDPEEAAKLAGEVFPEMVDHPAGGLPQLPEGQSITNIIGANAA